MLNGRDTWPTQRQINGDVVELEITDHWSGQEAEFEEAINPQQGLQPFQGVLRDVSRIPSDRHTGQRHVHRHGSHGRISTRQANVVGQQRIDICQRDIERLRELQHQFVDLLKGRHLRRQWVRNDINKVDGRSRAIQLGQIQHIRLCIELDRVRTGQRIRFHHCGTQCLATEVVSHDAVTGDRIHRVERRIHKEATELEGSNINLPENTRDTALVSRRRRRNHWQAGLTRIDGRAAK